MGGCGWMWMMDVVGVTLLLRCGVVYTAESDAQHPSTRRLFLSLYPSIHPSIYLSIYLSKQGVPFEGVPPLQGSCPPMRPAPARPACVASLLPSSVADAPAKQRRLRSCKQRRLRSCRPRRFAPARQAHGFFTKRAFL